MTEQKHLVVVGGVAGGMSCAARARRLDEQASIIVLETGPYVSFANCGLPYFVSGEITKESALLVQTPESLKASLNLDVRVNQGVTAIDPAAKTVTVTGPEGEYQLGYDALVLSPGADAMRPPLPGIDSPRIHTLRTVDDARTLHQLVTGGAKRAVVLGAGFIGLEAAEALNHQGLQTSLVELAPHVLPPLETEMAWWVERELERLGVDLHVGVGAQRIEHLDSHDVVHLADGTAIEADLIVLSVGVRPHTGFAESAGIATDRGAIIVDEHGRTNVPDIWAVGDATMSVDAATGIRRPVALAGPANREGRLIADDIFRPGSARPLAAAGSTAIVRAGELTAAMTGANRASLDQAGLNYTTLHAHPNQHAGYFPGASAVHIMMHFSPVDGTIYGAQAVGAEGVDKRIDVVATAMRGGLKINDLIDLDLSYSPPYGSAKDPVNFLGYAGENVLNGTLKLWFASDWQATSDEALILDVRRLDEWQAIHAENAMHIPHTELRARIDEVREAAAGRPVRVFCQSGVRSAIAHRILTAAGFDSASLSGGMLTMKSSGVPLITSKG
ncbi:MAG: FAD-dependent oxidoreductase [Microbacteriaceae bacterium]